MNREAIRSALAALVAIAVVAEACLWLLPPEVTPIMTASMGASALLIFAIPFSPLSQPWPVVGGTLISTAVGIVCVQYVPHLPLALALATGLAMVAMQLTGSLHPPGGAAALIAVLAGHEHGIGWDVLLLPVGINVALLALLGLVLNRWVLHRSHPHLGPTPSPAPTWCAMKTSTLRCVNSAHRSMCRKRIYISSYGRRWHRHAAVGAVGESGGAGEWAAFFHPPKPPVIQ
ncbi:MAG: hypothetical protein COX57_12350 [Alphaproteobacteria bacterium CG_4_10_14_0_2_um_filter_63_37]|nr:MAG: hypothetical protein AUJ55_09845 [Proteobacteria bacterium CG1_02_64_396]PJA23762.1 MAG: hypothetical protein COX57_12350 [Alphaproteobacteria bacterium CG_4_10_14_0_2_um_filter_63_37]